ncbi:GSCFA domain-containing protein [Amylibacter sp. IMCC11727]|uniref:GSCFA domain-containing protein n=1 Tax=Amylibacter sp. IMCC11727 TaxID=3039851 RepID=UPI00244DDB3B|nr:GSCFA domain-containing protein [Amylibacter sp. IMCC11727]WGI23061.1 GSCFA domain-containing protein [Amylibacter sp. IMCC11727]
MAGSFDANVHVFKNYRYPEIVADFDHALVMMQGMNPDINVLLTVSPVPLTATASDDHVLAATTYSKSVLRSVAGDLAHGHDCVDYFPSYEVISGTPTKGMFYEQNLRSVAREGVDVVMGYFFGGLRLGQDAVERVDDVAARIDAMIEQEEADELVCEEMALELSNAS